MGKFQGAACDKCMENFQGAACDKCIAGRQGEACDEVCLVDGSSCDPNGEACCGPSTCVVTLFFNYCG